MKIQFKKILILSLFITTCLQFGFSQETAYEIDFTKIEEFTITGSSTLHDYSISIAKIGGDPQVLTTTFEEGTSIDKFYFFVEVESMNSGRGPTMDGKIKKALKATEFPKIEYHQTTPALISASSEVEADFQLLSKGNLTVAGVTKEVEISLRGKKEVHENIVLRGKKALKFSQFDIEAPSALFGQIVCGDDIQVNIVLHLQKK